MAKRKIIWSHKARIKLFDILLYYSARNKNKNYSGKLYRKINREIRLLVKQSEIGILTSDNTIRGLIVDDYIIYYESQTESIIIHTIWDCRQNPDDLRIK